MSAVTSAYPDDERLTEVLRQSIYDPGAFVLRGDVLRGDDSYREPLHWWQARAVLTALDRAGYRIERVDVPARQVVDR